MNDLTSAATDPEFTDSTITNVTPSENGTGWEIGSEEGAFWVPAEHGVEPRVGDPVRFYGRGFGYVVRGLRIRDEMVFYRTDAEQREHDRRQLEARDKADRARFEAARAEQDARIAALPECFRQRVARFQRGRLAFRWKHEGYELMCCEQAVLIADTLKTTDAVRAFAQASNEEQMALVPGIDPGHSGNSFAFSCRLAHHYLTDPELVVREHGALAILVGCDDYGCLHPTAVEAQP